MTVIRFKGEKAESSGLVDFVKSLPTLKNLKVYGLEAEKLSPEKLSPATRRLLIREKNTAS